MGPVNTPCDKDSDHVNFIRRNHELLHRQMERMYEHDFNERTRVGETMMSLDDKRALSIMQRTMRKVDGHYEMGLPWKHDGMKLLNNRIVAEKRLSYVQRKLERDPELFQRYCEKFELYLDTGQGDKFRLVFDGAATYQGVSLNSSLL